MLASVVISTYNRAAALPATLDALANQDISPDQYEVLVVDDGSVDDTGEVLGRLSVPYDLRVFRLSENRGVSAGRNVGLRNARGRFIIMISDDLIVPSDFISTHVATLERFPNRWVVGGFTQLAELTSTPFGRYLDALERRFQEQRLGAEIGAGIYEMPMPTARNLSLPRSDLDRVGLFDERFRVTCEDLDLVRRAEGQDIRFIYNSALECVHNDQAADLSRYCRFQERGARDTAFLWDKYPQLDAPSEIVTRNTYVQRSDSPLLKLRKRVLLVLTKGPMLGTLHRVVAALERMKFSEHLLDRMYAYLIGIHTFRGFRTGLAELSRSRG